MATEPKAATEDAKIDLFEDDDEFEEFETEGCKRQGFIVFVNCVHLKCMTYCTAVYDNVVYTKRTSVDRFPRKLVEWDDKEEGKEATQQWEDDWDDDDVNDDFSLQLKRELENNAEKS
ncbi:hypothetical protein HHK36_007077 [Tetracentron sinense]|uniref:26S proteasome complex subunit SEM1 n=1 Tax=Tetracentron sinense TaxID=13715 RepID=A0A834ZK93_TETSI|nr:hypothetical protein HHK36_007077 [Tetracentron sinense]